MRKSLIAITIAAYLLAGCSGSTDRDSVGASASESSASVVLDLNNQNTSIVEFEITVPVYQSSELSVVLSWGDHSFNAAWVTDESWSLVEELPVGSEQQFNVTFYDRNGAIALASYEQALNTATSEGQLIIVNADQFDSDRWDDDADGTSNLDELRAGSNPSDASTTVDDLEVVDAPTDGLDEESEAFDLIGVYDELTESIAGFQLDKMEYFVRDVYYQIAQQTTLQFLADGYYEVQLSTRANTPPVTVCEGNGDCQILPGDYIVINHTTGDRVEESVAYVDPREVPNAIVLADELNTTVSSEGPVTVERTQYNCQFGGSMIREYSENSAPVAETLLIDSPEYRMVTVNNRDATSYLFDQCRFNLIDSTLPSGVYEINGNVHYNFSLHNFSDYTGYVTHTHYWNFDDFSILGDDGLDYQVDGEAELYRYRREGGYFFHGIRKTVLNHFSKTAADGTVIEEVNNGRYDTENAWNYGGYALATSESVSGSVQIPGTANQEVSVTTSTALTSKLQAEDYTGGNAESPFNGTIEMLAEDGSLLYIEADPVNHGPNFSSQWALFDLTTLDADQIIESDPYSTSGLSTPICDSTRYNDTWPYINSRTKRLYCSNSEFIPF